LVLLASGVYAQKYCKKAIVHAYQRNSMPGNFPQRETAEEGQINGGLGSAIAELVGEEHPVPLKRIGMRDRFGESGDPDELLEHFGLTAKHIAMAAHEIITRKQKEK